MSNITEYEKGIFRIVMKDTIKRISISDADSDRDIIGKIFTRFYQSAYRSALLTNELRSKLPRRIKRFDNYVPIEKYIAKLISIALLEIKKLKANDNTIILKESLRRMMIIVREASSIETQSEQIINQLSKIERNMNNV